MKGRFITFEGMEGSGKSTQVELLAGKLREKGYKVVATREPGGTRIAEQIRKITHNPDNVDLTDKAEAYLMAASRAQHIAQIIKPALKKGIIVICDRFVDSSLAYQGYGRQLGAKEISQLNELAVGDIAPDLTILLEIDLDCGMRRRNNSNKVDRLDLQQKEFYERVQEGYRAIVKNNPNRVVVIDGSGKIKKVAERVWKVVKNKL